MELSAIQSIAEIAGSIATVMTLIYLAIQIRENTATSKREALDGLVDRLNQWTRSLRENPDLLDLYTKGNLNFDSLSYENKLKYHFILSELFMYCESALGHAKDDGIKQESEEGTKNLLRQHLSQPGVVQWWEKLGKNSFARDYTVLVDGLLGD